MKKNLVIAVLLLWNFLLMGVLVYVWFTGSRSSHVVPNVAFSTDAKENGAIVPAQEFTFKSGEHLNGDVAPQIADRSFSISAVFDSQQQDGVIVAQGGLAHGYSLFVQDGELLFGVRRNQNLTLVSGGKLNEGQHKVTASFSKAGEISLILDTRPPVTGQAAGPIALTPVDGLDVGADRGAPVGPYTVPNSFSGTIETVIVKTFP